MARRQRVAARVGIAADVIHLEEPGHGLLLEPLARVPGVDPARAASSAAWRGRGRGVPHTAPARCRAGPTAGRTRRASPRTGGLPARRAASSSGVEARARGQRRSLGVLCCAWNRALGPLRPPRQRTASAPPGERPTPPGSAPCLASIRPSPAWPASHTRSRPASADRTSPTPRADSKPSAGSRRLAPNDEGRRATCARDGRARVHQRAAEPVPLDAREHGDRARWRARSRPRPRRRPRPGTATAAGGRRSVPPAATATSDSQPSGASARIRSTMSASSGR